LQNTVTVNAANRNGIGADRSRFVQQTQYDKTMFVAYLQDVKKQEARTARDNATFVGTFIKSGKSPEDFVKSYEKPNSYNNALKAVNHYCDFLGMPRPNLKPKPRAINKLIVAPKSDDVKGIVKNIQSLDVKAYIALCATVGLRPQRLLVAKWSEIDFENNIVNINEKHGMKIYRPNCLHKDVADLLKQLKSQGKDDKRVFTFAYKKVQAELKAIGTKWRPNNMRDHFYNEARKHCDHDQIEWAMGHSLPGVRAHYLADEIKTEYAKFETAFRLEIA
jgi:integrase